ncbi:hypothetical protein SAMN05444171_5944 [Bradyrhizobium lablabi]|jgi:hypothetical protein|uniref:Uncharacterized protein n=2 Tax=Bradyrhizobium TaxID=374 RepID=A0ABY0PAJ0_9BRAD|nr:hypothetical protein SAMN05444163_1226 [Bradyrhizobium ottawaense]SEE00567.1 hypothetical protein SAMN05444171_5944 [Bradyrhizobium lablabi]
MRRGASLYKPLPGVYIAANEPSARPQTNDLRKWEE